MTSRLLGWLLGGSLLLSLAGCEVGKCDEDAGCGIDIDDFGDGDGDLDGGGHSDAGTHDGGNGKGDAGPSAGDAGHDGGGGPVIGEPLSLADFCDEQAKRRREWEDKIETCCDGNPDAHSDNATAILNIFGRDNGAQLNCIDKYTPFIDNDTIDYVDTKAAACAAAFVAQFSAPPAACPATGFDSAGIRATVGHGFQLLVQLPACRAALVGKVARDQPCMDSLQCADGNRCRTAPGGSGSKTCQPAVNSSVTSGICETFSDCSDGYVCTGEPGNRVCLPANDLVNDGGKCANDIECKPNLVCSVQVAAGGKCGVPPAGTADDVCE